MIRVGQLKWLTLLIRLKMVSSDSHTAFIRIPQGMAYAFLASVQACWFFQKSVTQTFSHNMVSTPSSTAAYSTHCLLRQDTTLLAQLQSCPCCLGMWSRISIRIYQTRLQKRLLITRIKRQILLVPLPASLESYKFYLEFCNSTDLLLNQTFRRFWNTSYCVHLFSFFLSY